MILLYDALTVLSPMEERWKVKELLRECMSSNNYWEIHGRRLQYTIDVGFTKRWGMKPSDAEKEILYSLENKPLN
jgi:hypothetical protein